MDKKVVDTVKGEEVSYADDALFNGGLPWLQQLK